MAKIYDLEDYRRAKLAEGRESLGGFTLTADVHSVVIPPCATLTEFLIALDEATDKLAALKWPKLPAAPIEPQYDTGQTLELPVLPESESFDV